jgi:hypothetical protein
MPEYLTGAALLPVTGATGHKADIPQALSATPIDTARDLREVKHDQTLSLKARDVLVTGGPDAYRRALETLREDTRRYWEECLSDPPSDGLSYAPMAEALLAWIDHYWQEWFDDPIAELEHRGAIKEQAIGAAYASDDLEKTAR